MVNNRKRDDNRGENNERKKEGENEWRHESNNLERGGGGQG
jgi:hypothetical protein